MLDPGWTEICKRDGASACLRHALPAPNPVAAEPLNHWPSCPGLTGPPQRTLHKAVCPTSLHPSLACPTHARPKAKRTHPGPGTIPIGLVIHGLWWAFCCTTYRCGGAKYIAYTPWLPVRAGQIWHFFNMNAKYTPSRMISRSFFFFSVLAEAEDDLGDQLDSLPRTNDAAGGMSRIATDKPPVSIFSCMDSGNNFMRSAPVPGFRIPRCVTCHLHVDVGLACWFLSSAAWSFSISVYNQFHVPCLGAVHITKPLSNDYQTNTALRRELFPMRGEHVENAVTSATNLSVSCSLLVTQRLAKVRFYSYFVVGCLIGQMPAAHRRSEIVREFFCGMAG
jgi:hypothetical protein